MTEGGTQESVTLYQQLFDLQFGLVQNYGLSPFEIRQSRFYEFCILINRLSDYNEREKKNTHNGMIKRKAKDNWF